MLCADAAAYDVAVGSHGNRLELEIGNVGGTTDLEAVRVAVVDSPSWVVNLDPVSCVVGTIKAGDSRTVSLRFGVRDTTTVSSSGTLRLKIFAADGRGWVTDLGLVACERLQGDMETAAKEVPPPTVFGLQQNFPNPFNPATNIGYSLPVNCRVKLEVFSVGGQRIALLVDRYETAGYKLVSWDGTNDQGERVSSGVYFYSLRADRVTEIKKMILLR